MPRENLLSLFADFTRHSRDVAIVQAQGYRRERFTYAELISHAAHLALELKRHNINTGDRLLLWSHNSFAWQAAFWACQLLGAIPVPMDDTSTPEFANRVAKLAAVRLILTTTQHEQQSTAAPALNLSDFSFTTAVESLAAIQKSAAARNLPWYETLCDHPITRGDLVQILFTSGTTAEPRGVLLTHGNFLANLEPLEKGIASYRNYERLFHPLRFVSVVPLSHVFGQFMTLLVPPLLGATVIFEPTNNPREILHTIKRERATVLVAVPRILSLLQKSLQQNAEASFGQRYAQAANKKFLNRAWQFRKLHFQLGWNFWAFIVGGAALPSDAEDFFKRLGYAVIQGYGMTETASLISLNHPFRATQGSIGKILPGRQFRLAEDGEILVCGENVSPGYWRSATEQQAGAPQPVQESDVTPYFREGDWLRTGDLGELDAQGNLRFRGRKKNVVVTSAGLNIYPEDLEAALRKQPAIRDCIVLPLDQDASDPVAALLLNPAEPNPQQAATQAVAAANATLADYQQIRTWLLWPDPDFPRTSTGKPRQSEIARVFVATTFRPSSSSLPSPSSPSSSSTPDSAIPNPPSSDASALTQLLSRYQSVPHTNLDENLNLSSLDRVELLSTLESQFHVELNESALSQAKTVADLQTLIAHPQSRSTGDPTSYPRWAQRAAVRILRLAVYYALVWPATAILGHPKVIGRQNLVDLISPALIISNHITRRADIGLILYALPPRLRHRLATAMGGETLQEMRHPPKDWAASKRAVYFLNYWLVTALFNVFPLPQFSGFRESFRFAGESADRGYSLLVFPEGIVNDTPDGRMAKFQPGIGLLARNLNLPIIPMRLNGIARMKQSHRRLARPGEITIHIGGPITFPPEISPDEITRQLESAVASLR